MYTLIDRDNMRFRGKHDDHVCLSKLAWIEDPHVAVVIWPLDTPQELAGFSDVELRLLYKHTTGVDHTSVNRAVLMASCYALFEQLPVTDINSYEIDIQYRSIEGGDYRRFLYAKGSSVPAQQGDLFEPVHLQTQPRFTNEHLMALVGLVGQKHVAAPIALATPRSPAVRPATPARGTVPAAPKGGQRTLIWERMDRIWEKADKTTNPKIILGLRKTCMDELEAECGVKRTSASSELGNWMKARCG